MFFDIEEDEDIDDNNYYKVMIKISYEENKAVDEEFPTNVLNEFLSLALADENFELAKEIRDILKAKEESGEEA
jgi:protein-arginine kinase activator protein McsA